MLRDDLVEIVIFRAIQKIGTAWNSAASLLGDLYGRQRL